MNLLTSTSRDDDLKYQEEGHLFLGVAEDGDGREIHVFLNKNEQLPQQDRKGIAANLARSLLTDAAFKDPMSKKVESHKARWICIYKGYANPARKDFGKRYEIQVSIMVEGKCYIVKRPFVYHRNHSPENRLHDFRSHIRSAMEVLGKKVIRGHNAEYKTTLNRTALFDPKETTASIS